jgi:hypothetical protein
MTFAEFQTAFEPLPRGVWPCPWLFGPGRMHYMVAMDSTGLAVGYGEFMDEESMRATETRLWRVLNEREPPAWLAAS